ncbi:glycosyltransferase family 2 protein [Erythrobacter sp.]|uniref:glycosyltransferase family 2 protein n=1 Tax=Erythrobacter sp. TaxID=1042 RepID=UPI001B2D26AA|nr:glycosyltransferase family 2 protein [Erythrobacter sp.]MBO6526343.1 glycosyltransferase [Erythrobacter sp.]MBO6530596.1 glycosyltransferase [Erythrobacter sp.]
MRISVVTAVFNRAGTIAEAMESVQRQTYQSVEHIIQDGGSSDGTLDEIARLSNDASQVVSERDFGIYDAINRGIIRATGDVVGLMHSDDFFANENILAKVAYAFIDPTIDGVYGDLQYVAANDPMRIVRHWRSGQYEPAFLKRGWMPPHPTLYLRRQVFERFGLYDTSFSIAADYDAMLRYLVQGQIKLAYIPEVLVKMRLGGESNRSFERILRKSREDFRAIRKNGVGGIGTLAAKNFSKLGQFIVKDETTK